MTRLRFLSPGEAGPQVARESPLADVELGGAVADASGLGKLEVRGGVGTLEPAEGEELLPLGPRRALLVFVGGTRAARERLAAAGYRAYDVTDGLAAIDVLGEDLMRRLTPLDLGALPAVGTVARGTPGVIQKRSDGVFRVFIPRELAQHVAEVAADAARGLGR